MKGECRDISLSRKEARKVKWENSFVRRHLLLLVMLAAVVLGGVIFEIVVSRVGIPPP